MSQEKPKSFEKWLQKHIDKKNIVKVYRTVTDGEANIYGFILEMSENFLLLQVNYDFDLDGYAIVRKDHFDGIRCDSHDKTVKKILKREGIIEAAYGINYDIDLSSWNSIFKDLQENHIHAIVECEDLKEPLFIIGKVVKVSKKSVRILYYNGNGIYDKIPTKVKFKDITLMKFDDRYSTIFQKYLRTQD